MKHRRFLAPTFIALAVSLLSLGGALAAGNETYNVNPINTLGWTFEDDNGKGDAGHGFVDGPGMPPAGTGSYRLALSAANQGTILYNSFGQGTRFADITRLQYSTYQTSNPGGFTAIALQFTADDDLTDADDGFKGRLVFEPYQGAAGQHRPDRGLADLESDGRRVVGNHVGQPPGPSAFRRGVPAEQPVHVDSGSVALPPRRHQQG